MAESYKELFSLLYEIGSRLEHLTELAQQKCRAVMTDDLLKLDEIMKEEQAESLVFRNLDRRRARCLEALGLRGSLSTLGDAGCPAEHRAEARRCADGLRQRYQAYQTASSRARELLEQSIGEIDAVVSEVGVEQEAGVGYQAAKAAPPSNMKTDFRA